MRMVIGLAVLVALLCISAAPLAAETNQAMRRGAPKGVTEVFYTCTDKAGGDIVGLGQCVTAEKKLQDARLNKAYSLLMGKLDGTGKEHLRAAERAWIEFNAKSVDTELDVRDTEKTANIDATVNEIYRYTERANTLEGLLAIVGE